MIATSSLRYFYRLARLCLCAPVPKRFRKSFWDKFCIPYLSWRDISFSCKTRDRLRMVVNPTYILENRICFFGVWEPYITDAFRRLLKPGDVVVDVGANVGYYSLLASKLVGPRGKVYALEPNAQIRSRLEDNIQLNQARNVTVIPYGAWHKRDAGMMYFEGNNRGSFSFSEQPDYQAAETGNLARLDDLIPPEDYTRIRLIKMDIEGSEYRAIQGMPEILQSNKTLEIILECNPLLLGGLGSSPRELFDLLSVSGFIPYLLPNDYAVDNYLYASSKLIARPMSGPVDHPCDVLFSRRSQDMPLSS